MVNESRTLFGPFCSDETPRRVYKGFQHSVYIPSYTMLQAELAEMARRDGTQHGRFGAERSIRSLQRLSWLTIPTQQESEV